MIDETGEQKGIVPLADAIKLAKEKNLDLVAISTEAVPVVCKVMDFSKFKYEREKKKKKTTKVSKSGRVKELRMGPLIGKHDLDTKTRHLREFLKEGYKVKVTVMFKGRQMAHVDIGKNILLSIINDLKDTATCEQNPILEGNRMSIMLRAGK